MSSRKLALIVAVSANNVIGVDGKLPWRLPSDLQRFKKLTMGHHLIMGRKTYESIGRLLPGRTTVIVTRQPDYRVAGALVAGSVAAAQELTSTDDSPFVIGGADIYRQFLPYVKELHVTRVHIEIRGDTFLPPINWDQWSLNEATQHPPDEKNSIAHSFERYQRMINKVGTENPQF